MLVAANVRCEEPTESDADRILWSIAGKLRGTLNTESASEESMEQVLLQERPEDILAFWYGLEQRIQESYRWDIWSVGAIVGGQLGTDFFRSYQIWIILQGREFFHAVLKDPEYAVKSIPAEGPTDVFDGLVFDVEPAVRAAYNKRSSARDPGLRLIQTDPEPAGTPWRWKDLPRMHPAIWQSFFLNRDRRPVQWDLARMKDYELVQAAAKSSSWVDIYSDPEYFVEQYKVLSKPQRFLHAVFWLIDEVNNGGFDQFFENSTGVVAPEALEGLKFFGAIEQHDTLAAIMAEFPGGQPSRYTTMRQDQRRQRWGKSTIDAEYSESNGSRSMKEPLKRAAEYIRAHPEEFFRPKK